MSPSESPDPAGGDDESVTCAHCDAVIDTSKWYPVRACVSGGYEIYHFCSVACRDAWSEGRDEGG